MKAPIRLRAWVYLAATVVLEVVATLSLKAADGFTVLGWSVLSIASYACTVVMLSLALREIPMGVAYVIWTGAGATGVVVLSAIIFADVISPSTWAGIALVIGGVVLINMRRSPESKEDQVAPQGHSE